GNYLRRAPWAAVAGFQGMPNGYQATPPLANLSMTNNVIDGTNLKSDWWGFELGAVQATALTGNSNLMTTSPLSNINVTNNFIANAGGSAVWTGNTNGGSVSGNYFSDPNARPDLTGLPPAYQPDATLPLVIDTTSTGITPANNTVDTTSGRMFVSDTQYRELAAYAPGATIRLNAYNLGTLSNPAVTLTDADGKTAALAIQNTTPQAI